MPLSLSESKVTTSFCFPIILFLDIHRNPKHKEFLKNYDYFLRGVLKGSTTILKKVSKSFVTPQSWVFSLRLGKKNIYHTFHIVATAVAFSAPPYIIAVLCQLFCFMQFRTVWIWIILIMIMVIRVVEFSSGGTKLERINILKEKY